MRRGWVGQGVQCVYIVCNGSAGGATTIPAGNSVHSTPFVLSIARRPFAPSSSVCWCAGRYGTELVVPDTPSSPSPFPTTSGDPSAALNQNLGGEQTWQKAFATTDVEEAEDACRRRGYEFTWESGSGDGGGGGSGEGAGHRGETLRIVSRRQALLRDDISGKDLWFNQASNVFSFVPHFADGTIIDDDMQEHINAVLWQATIAFKWSVGDVLVLDNELCM